jgi:outer membrane protein assembly factor BamD (BamD/ComL family)
MTTMHPVRGAGLLLLAVAVAQPVFAQSAPAKSPEEVFNPYQAEKDLEVGRYYLKEKNYDAAIARFESSIRNKPNFAMPHKLMGEAYEGKGELAEAVRFYRLYLKILPAAQDAEKVQKRIARLETAMKRAAERRKPTG